MSLIEKVITINICYNVRTFREKNFDFKPFQKLNTFKLEALTALS